MKLNIKFCSIFYVLLVTTLSLALTACGGDKPTKNAKGFVEQVKQQPVQKVQPLPQAKKIETVKYSSQNLRSPFTPQKAEITHDSQSPDTNRPKEELEAYPLDSLRMVGTLSQGQRTWALISAPNKSVYKVTIGSHIGQNYGRIINIEKDKLDIEETVPDGLGGWKERSAYLSLTE